MNVHQRLQFLDIFSYIQWLCTIGLNSLMSPATYYGTLLSNLVVL